MKNTLLLLFVIVFSLKMEAQTFEASTTIPTNEYLDLLAANLEIPEEISKKYANSSIDITFILTITKDGSVFNPKIQNDSLQLESNLKKAVEKLPKWNPKTEDGIAVVSRKAFNLVIPIDQIIEEQPIAGKIYTKATPKDGLEKFGEKVRNNFYITDQERGYLSLAKTKTTLDIAIDFIIEKDGSVSSFRMADPELEYFQKRMMQAVKSAAKKWVPATINGSPVRTKFTYTLTLKTDFHSLNI